MNNVLMVVRFAVAAMLVAVAGCSSSGSNISDGRVVVVDANIDATSSDGRAQPPDAMAITVDAQPQVVDAPRAVPDAAFAAPDAQRNSTDAPVVVADARQNSSDAAVVVADARRNSSDATVVLADARRNSSDATSPIDDAAPLPVDAAPLPVDAATPRPDARAALADARPTTPDASGLAIDATASPADALSQVCGDGVVEGDEQCDDGNSNDFDSCTNDCTLPPTVTLISRSTAGDIGDSNSGVMEGPVFSQLSTDGRFVAFSSLADNLTPNSVANEDEIFVRDTQNGTTTLVSVDSSGNPGDSDSYYPSMSADGRFVAFQSNADNLVANDTNGNSDVFVHDNVLGTTAMVSVDSNGVQGDNASYAPFISANGRYVVFMSVADNLSPNDDNASADVFVRDLQANITTVASVGDDGALGDSDSEFPTISADGRFVAFLSNADDLVLNDTNGAADAFVRDMAFSVTTLVTVNTSGVSSDGGSGFYPPTISADGRFVAFGSAGDDLVLNDSNGAFDVFVRDLAAGTTTLISVAANGEQGDADSNDAHISSDGRFVAFESSADNLVDDDNNGVSDIFLYDMLVGSLTLVSTDANGVESDGTSFAPSFSADDQFLTFTSIADNLVADDSNGSFDVFRSSNFPQQGVLARTDGAKTTETGGQVHISIQLGTQPTADVGVAFAVSDPTQATLSTTSLVFTNANWNIAQTVTVTGVNNGLLGGQAGYAINFSAAVSGDPIYSGMATPSINLVNVNDDIQRVSQSNGFGPPALSADGRFVAYSDGTNVFVYDIQNAAFTYQAPGVGFPPALSADGRFVAYKEPGTAGTGLVVVDTVVSQTPTLVSFDLNDEVDSSASEPAISADGRYVAFTSSADNLVANDGNGHSDVFVRDMEFGTTTLVSIDSTNSHSGDQSSDFPSISADGRYVAFESSADNLVDGDTNNHQDAFVRDTLTGTTTLVSVSSDGVVGNQTSYYASISASGQFVAFNSDATNLITDDTNGFTDVFVYDMATATTTRVSVDSAGDQSNQISYYIIPPSMSGDGRFVAFCAFASNLVANDTNGFYDIFVHDRTTGTTRRVDVDINGHQSNGNSFNPSLSTDGRYIAFSSQAFNLVPDVTSGQDDDYVVGNPF